MHKSDLLAEMVCSNSLRSDALDNAVGLLHEEMRRLELEHTNKHRRQVGGENRVVLGVIRPIQTPQAHPSSARFRAQRGACNMRDALSRARGNGR